ncbi:zinc finger protein 638 isoform X3 [Kryptolebias marmoratus]|uniref:zinc finger protein 638 isoform X3 n=1 Tax=Kryptolebias marmoratus TaxID=37003 RepID=UPI000D52F2D7|nr:zinc finger protein 638 isoform X3 [Kryptolebias marmoratus]
MEKINKKKRPPGTNMNTKKTTHQDTRFICGPVIVAAALRLSQIQSLTQIALRQIAVLASIIVGGQIHQSELAAVLAHHLAHLSLLTRQKVLALGLDVQTNRTSSTVTGLGPSAEMYHPQQQGSQPFPNTSRPPASQHPNNLQPMDFQFSCPNQLPDALESALAIRGRRDMDHRKMDHINQPNQHQNQGSGSGIGQHRDYGSNPVSLPADNQSGLQQGVDWSNYQLPTKLFASHPPTPGHQGIQLHNQNNQTGARTLNWKPPVRDLPSPQTRQTHGAGGGGEGQTFYTPESAGSILASFGLSNEDLEVLSHYPDDQLTPDTLPFILRDIQINKSGPQKPAPSTSLTFSHNIRDRAVPPPCSPEVPSILTVTQTAGKIIDYGHASRGKDDNDTRETFKREPLSSERTVKMYPATSSAAIPKVEKNERHVLEHKEPSQDDEDYRRTSREKHRDEDYRRTTRERHGDEDYRKTSREKHRDEDYRRMSREKHGDEDYRRTSREKHGDEDYRRISREKCRSSHSPGRQFAPLPKSHHLDKDYRHMESKLRSEGSSKLPLSSSSDSRPHGSSSKKLPTPTMINDFAAVSPKVYPHTCSLCNIQSDQEKDWVDHINTVDHTAACRDLRNNRSGHYGSRALSDLKDGSPFDSVSRSLSHSPSPGSHHGCTYPHRPHGRPYSPHRHPRSHHYPERSHWFDHHRSRSPPYSHRTTLPPREHHSERRSRESSGSFSRTGSKRLHDGSVDTSRSPSSSAADHSSKHESLPHTSKTVKGAPKPGTKMTKTVKPPPAKKKKVVAPASQDLSVAERLVYLTGIPNDATEQEVTDMVGSFGKINNVILMPCSEEESEKGQKASVCMMRAEDAQALASAPNLCIREQEITASVAKKPEDEQFSNINSKHDANTDKDAVGSAVSSSAGGDADQKTPNQKCKVLITGLPVSGCSETDIIQLVQPFGTPSDIILSTNIRKALVSLVDLEVAQEMVKVHSFKPAVINNTEVKMGLLKQHIDFSTPVALYNLFMGSVDPLENLAPVVWSSLLVIKNVPETPSGSSEVIKLVQRFGTVIKTLVLNNMVICEMATAAMALSVYKRFQTFPCIIQNNPLFFSRKADPKANTNTKVIVAYCDSSEVKPVGSKDTEAAAAALKEEAASYPEISEAPVENDCDENIKRIEKSAEDESLEQAECKDDKKFEFGVSESSAILVTKPYSESPTELREILAVESETTVVSKEVENMGEMKPASCDGTSRETVLPKLPQMTQAMVNALLEQCRTRTANNSNNTAAPLSEKQQEAQQQLDQGDKTAEKTKDLSKNATEEEEVVKKQERERKDREARKEKERRTWEKERAKRERERAEKARRERDRREDERREREKRDRRRDYGERQFGLRSSYRSEGYRQRDWRDERSSMEAENRKEDEEEFPFNMSDFVTVDEVGDVTDLPFSSLPTVHVETSQEQSDSPKTGQHDVPEDTLVESTMTQEQSDEKISESEHVSILSVEEPDSTPEEDLSTPLLASQGHCFPSETQCLAEAPGHDINPKTDILLAASLDSSFNVEPLLMPAHVISADSGSDCLAVSVVTTKSEEEKESCPVTHSPTQDIGMEASNSQEQEAQDEEKDSSPVTHSLTQDIGMEASNSQEQEAQDEEKDSSPVTHSPTQDIGMEASNSQEQDEEKDGGSVTHSPTQDIGMEASNSQEQDAQDEEKDCSPVAHCPTQNKGMEAPNSQEQDTQVEEKQEVTDGKAAPGNPGKTEDTMNTDQLLPPYDPRTPVGMEYLVPKTGFFCKACSRFFSGGKMAEISHCRTLKHYENLKKLLQTAEPESEQTPTD